MSSNEEARGMFLRGLLVLNALLAPIAGLGLYMTYLGKRSGNGSLLAIGIVMTVLSPLLAYAAARPLLRRITEARDATSNRGAGPKP
jgi:hypothetical protein